ncbi:cytidylyltransferase domain-containing protein [Kordiimonas sp.]|uniref:cytidylyltransferase domain-containing protein n=1 Tax=Kordiimonas sp. TaxID=1970157 RepID=UPI003A8DFBF4
MAGLHCICVIQARRTSSRLPDKVLKSLAGVPVLQRVIDRCERIDGVDKVIIAMPEGDHNAPLRAAAEHAGAAVVLGSEADVLSRYLKALEAYPASYVMRVTSDCPFLDPEVSGGLLASMIEHGADYGATALWPHGLDSEVMTAKALRLAGEKAENPLDREHVTLWLKRAEGIRRYIHMADRNYTTDQRWVLDYPEDFAFLEALCTELPPHPVMPGWREILAVCEQNPALGAINRMRITEWADKNQQIIRDAAD